MHYINFASGLARVWGMRRHLDWKGIGGTREERDRRGGCFGRDETSGVTGGVDGLLLWGGGFWGWLLCLGVFC